jgi:hypothetical protein
MAKVAGNEMPGSGRYRGQKNGNVLIGQHYTPRELTRNRIEKFHGSGQFLQPAFLQALGEVEPCFLQGVVR